MSTPDLRAQLVQIDASIAEHKLSLKGLEGDKLAVTAELRSRACFPVLTLPVEITLGLLPKWRCRLSRLQSLSILRSPTPNPQHLLNFLYRRSTSAKLAPLQSFSLVYHPGVLFPVPEELTTRQYESSSGRKWRFSTTNRMFAMSGIDLRVERGKTSLVSYVRQPG
ncbi:hypothetical protein C8R46DRAFT_1093661, partial [Mycena filopes]